MGDGLPRTSRRIVVRIDDDGQERAFRRAATGLLTGALALAWLGYRGELTWLSAGVAILFVVGVSLVVGAVAAAARRKTPSASQELAAGCGLTLTGAGILATALFVRSWDWMLAGMLALGHGFVRGDPGPAAEPVEPEMPDDAEHYDFDLDEDELEFEAYNAEVAEHERRDAQRRDAARDRRDVFPL